MKYGRPIPPERLPEFEESDLFQKWKQSKSYKNSSRVFLVLSYLSYITTLLFANNLFEQVKARHYGVPNTIFTHNHGNYILIMFLSAIIAYVMQIKSPAKRLFVNFIALMGLHIALDIIRKNVY